MYESIMYERIKYLFLENKLTINGLEKAVEMKWISAEQKEEIIKNKSE